jgi:hypothetical protein
MEDLVKLQYYLSQDQVQAALEMSQRGGHLWIFLETPLPARDCRLYIHNLASRLGVPVKGNGLAEGIEIFPKHDELGPGEFGNAIRGPLGIHRGASRRFWFYGAEYDLGNQIAYLKQLKKVSEEEMNRFVAGKTLPAEAVRPVRNPEPAAPRAGSGRLEFRILEHVGKVRPELLSAFDANSFPSPRSWEFVSRILDSLDSQPNATIEHEVIAGAVGIGAAMEFSAFLFVIERNSRGFPSC